ncbi:MAG TPA: Nramp family divalent metal transporter [Candidatus Bathyarchaeia archaeon]|nr:Nramp family divalent metal transporter [Candidatus Bathyarchaeia archaeon]
MRFPWKGSAKPQQQVLVEAPVQQTRTGVSLRSFVLWLGPALMVSIAYMDPGNYGTDIAAGAGFKYDLLWAAWLAGGMAMLLQYLSGKLGIVSGYSLPELVRKSLVKRRYVIPYWLAAEAAAAATDLAEYLGTVIGLNLLFGIPLLYASVFGALDVILLLSMMGRRFRLIEQYFAMLISILVIGILYNLAVVKPDLTQIGYHSVVPLASSNAAFLIVVGMIGATVMPHALFVHSWLSKNKMDLLGRKNNGGNLGTSITDSMKASNHHPYSTEEIRRTNRFHLKETVLALAIASVVNVGIVLIAIPLYPNANVTFPDFVREIGQMFGPTIAIIFILTLLASGLSSSALGTIAGQVIMEGLIGKHWNVWARRIVTRFINVFPTTFAILLGFDPLLLLVYSQVILSLMIPLPMIPLVYYTSKKKFMAGFVNRRTTIVLAIVTVAVILAFNSFLLYAIFTP